MDEYEGLFINNPINNSIFRRRVEGIGVIHREEAINWGISGLMVLNP
ncbi:MAG: hypothetical protein GC195_09295 [Nostoc sp. RI_552]|jgi:NAD(P)H-quinone oxidoreductase subunit H|nr:hypothetical protein [Nostoc sp. RI_552]